MKYAWTVMISGLLMGLAGCMAHQGTPRAEAQRRWAETRGRVLNGVAEEQFNAGDLLEPRLLMARVAIEQGKFVDADEHLKQAASKDPNQPRIVYLQAIVEERREHYPEALKLYERAGELDSKNQAYLLATVEVMVRLDRAEEALALLESKLPTMDPTAGLYSAAGKVATLVEKHDKAAMYYSRAHALWPDNNEIQSQLAKAYYFSGQHAQAVRELEELVARTKDETPTWVLSMLGQSYLADQQASKAKEIFTQLTSKEPRVASHWVGLAKAALAAGDATRAMASARAAIALDPAQAEASVVLGYVLLKQGQNQKANSMLVGAARLHPDNPTLLCLLGRSYDALKQHEQALKCYKAAAAIQPGNRFAQMLATDSAQP
jgi:tetratricopeptide (TPR) repeat protein